MSTENLLTEAKSHLAGVRQQSYGRLADGKVFIHLDHPTQICPEDEASIRATM